MEGDQSAAEEDGPELEAPAPAASARTKKKRSRPSEAHHVEESLSSCCPTGTASSSSARSQSTSKNQNDDSTKQPEAAVVQTPHTIRLLRLAVSGTTDHSIAARSLLSDLASRSKPEILWDLLGRLVAASSGTGSSRAGNTGLYSSKWSERANAAGTIGAIAGKLPGVDRRGFLADDGTATDHDDDDDDSSSNNREEDNDAGLWLRVEDLLDDCSEYAANECAVRKDENSSNDDSNNDNDGISNKRQNKLDTILEEGRLLLSSSAESYDDDEHDGEDERALRELDESAVGGRGDDGGGGNQNSNTRIDSFLKRRVRLQRQILAKRLGLGGILSAPVMSSSAGDGGGDGGTTADIVERMVDDSDLLPASFRSNGAADKSIGTSTDGDNAASQARRRNMERRNKKRRRAGDNTTCSSSHGDKADSEQGVTLRALLVLEMRRSTGEGRIGDGGDVSGRAAARAAPSHRNPQTLLATDLLYRTFDADWTVRHGALMGILALMKSWMAGFDVAQSSSDCFGRWPHDIMARCLCILALDRFGDYSGSAVEGPGDGGGDRVVAPVRETAAQLLSLILSMAPESVQENCHTVLHRLVRHDGAWEVRHGSMLAFKYVVALRIGYLVEKEDRSPSATCDCWHNIPSLAIFGLSDESDDVRGTSAQVLSCYFRDKGNENISLLDRVVEECSKPLWSALLHVGTVSSCAVDVVLLFADIMSYNCDLVLRSVHPIMFNEHCLDFSSVLVKLAGFLKSDDAAIKLSSLRALGTIARPLINKAVAYQGTKCDGNSLLIPTAKAYCGLISDLFATYFEDEFDCVTDDCTGGDEAAAVAVERLDVLSTTRNDAWTQVTDSLPLLWTQNACSGSTEKRHNDRKDCRILLFRTFSSLILRFIGIERRSDAHSTSPDRRSTRINDSLDTLEEKAPTTFRRQRMAAKALAQLCFQLGSSQSKESSRICSSSSSRFLANLLRCLSKSPWPMLCEAACVLFAAVGDVFAEKRIEYPALFQCRELFTAMLTDSPCCIRTVSEDSASLLRDPTLMNSCDVALIAMLDTNAEALAGVEDAQCAADELPVTSDHVLGLWKRFFGAKGAVLRIDASTTGAEECGGSTRLLTISSMRLSSVIAGAVIAWGLRDLPVKLTPIIRPLMTSLKNEEATARLDWTCFYLSCLLSLSSARHGDQEEALVPIHVRDKILANVCTVALADVTPISQRAGKQLLRMIAMDLDGEICSVSPFYSILTPLKSRDIWTHSVTELSRALGLLLLLSQPLRSSSKANEQNTDEMIPAVVQLACTSPSCGLRSQAVDVATVLCESDDPSLRTVLPLLLKFLSSDGTDNQRLNACLLLQNILDATGIRISPFIRCLLPVTMSLMTDPVEECARLAAGAFAALVRVSPLVEKRSEASKSDLGHLSDAKSNTVIDHLIHGEPLPSLQLPNHIQACLGESGTTLRGYQQEGIAWMHFLQSVKLNGALCDDMGVGKSLQALIGIAIAHSELDLDRPPVSLVVCPSTVVGHWMNEIQRYFPGGEVFSPLKYTGPLNKRKDMLREQLCGCNIVLTSYSVLRNDIDVLSSLSWVYCVLDEGHLLKNPKSATAKASRRIKSQHKLILTGTPVQNNVNELWAVFDFLMPNFLGTEAAFTKSFAKPIINGQVAGAPPAAISLGMKKLKLLHQTVLPFILRREKQDVMEELPPKVITDIPCALSQEQAALYREFIASSKAKDALAALQQSMQSAHEGDLDGAGGGKKKSLGQEVFKSLLYLRLLCVHPLLVVKRRQDLRSAADLSGIGNGGDSITEAYSRLDCSGKLMALKDLLQSAAICSDGLTAADNDQSTFYAGRISADTPDASSEDLAGGHTDDDLGADGLVTAEDTARATSKCLIFAQFTQSLDIVEEFLFAPHMPSLRYLRLDGKVAPEERTKIVDQFNDDESIKVMLLTTRVGGLGLNLQKLKRQMPSRPRSTLARLAWLKSLPGLGRVSCVSYT